MTDNPWLSAMQIDLSKPPPPRWRGSHRWGGWTLEGDHLCFGKRGYVFSLDDVTGSAKVLDMIVQISLKSWATDEVLAGLVRALDDIFDPQALLCSRGGDKRITPEHTRARIARAHKMLAEEPPR